MFVAVSVAPCLLLCQSVASRLLPGQSAAPCLLLCQLHHVYCYVNCTMFVSNSGRSEGRTCFETSDCGAYMDCSGLYGNQTCECRGGYVPRRDGTCGSWHLILLLLLLLLFSLSRSLWPFFLFSYLLLLCQQLMLTAL